MAGRLMFNKALALQDKIKDLNGRGLSQDNDPNGEFKGTVRKYEEAKSQLQRRQLKLLGIR